MKKFLGGRDDGKRTLHGVSEVVGTILLLGISLMMVGGMALWTSQIQDMEEGLYVDLFASLRGEILTITHRGGDTLTGAETEITINDGTTSWSYKYYDPANGRTDDSWDNGDSIDLPLYGSGLQLTIIVTTVKQDGVRTVVLNNELTKSMIPDGTPDLAVTRLSIHRPGISVTGYILDYGKCIITLEVKNIGDAMSVPWIVPDSDTTISNTQIRDDLDVLKITGLSYTHRDEMGVAIEDDDDGYQILGEDHTLEIVLTLDEAKQTPRTLGDHELKVMVLPFEGGERDYRNNIVTRKYRVDKDINPEQVPGPDPGIYDVYFSDYNPKRGDRVTVTIVVQNSGSEMITKDMGVHLVVSLYAPAQRTIDIGEEKGVQVYDWRMDDQGLDEAWRMDHDDTLLQDDRVFPTCIIPNLEILPGAYLFIDLDLVARSDLPGGTQTVYAVVNAFDGYDEPVGILPSEGDVMDGNDNIGLGMIQVFPRVLLVDNDGEKTASKDMTSSVMESLIGAGINVDSTVIAQQVSDQYGDRDAPAYTYDRSNVPTPAMEDFDIVIWVTGYRKDALSNTPEGSYGGNIQEIMKYMDSNGYFLLVGANPIDSLIQYFQYDGIEKVANEPDPFWEGKSEFTDASNFVHNYLGIKRIIPGVDLPLAESNRVIGIDGLPGGITEVEEGTYNILLNELAEGNGLSTLFYPRIDVIEKDMSPYFDRPLGVLSYQDEIGTGYVNTIRAWSEVDDIKTEPQYRAVVMAWDITQTRYLNQKIDIIARVMKWMDWEIQTGRDLAVTKMELLLLSQDEDGNWHRDPIDNEEIVPKYLDTIEIEVTIRNNGYQEESTTLIFSVIGPNGKKLLVTPNIPDPRPSEEWPEGKSDKTDDDNPVDISSVRGSGGEETRYKLWLALGSGLYNFEVMVDPYDLVDEINEDNNDISYSTTTLASFIAQNNILVVDDDGSIDNFRVEDQVLAGEEGDDVAIPYPSGEPSQAIVRSLQLMGFDHYVITTENYYDTSAWVFGSGPTVEELKRYNSVIWVTGDSGSLADHDMETLTDPDILNLAKYLNGIYEEALFLGSDHNENLMLTGRYLLEDVSGAGDHLISDPDLTTSNHGFLRDYLGVEPLSASPEQLERNSLWGERTGVFGPEVYMGLELGSSDLAGDGEFIFQPITTYSPDDSTVKSAFRTDDASAGPIASSQHWHHYDHDEVVGDYFRTIFHSWNMDELAGSPSDPDLGTPDLEYPLEEVVFLSLKWFDTPIEAPELVSRNMLLEIDHDHPSIGNTYLVTLKLANIGGESGWGTVRFLDGGTLFSSRYIFVDPMRQMTIEAIWEPQYAGTRTIKVVIDWFDACDEFFDVWNNVVTRTIEVYFFWDDMEGGGYENFEHDSLVAMINGENPLDFFDPMDDDPQTNVLSSWDTEMSHGLKTVSDTYKSAPYSYQLEETTGEVKGNADVLISFVIDDSASMRERSSSEDADKTWLDMAKDAALVLLNELSNDSVVVSIWDFQGNAERRFSGPTDRGTSEGGIQTKVTRDPVRIGDDFGGSSGREKVRAEIETMNNNAGTTILWDCIGEAYKDTLYWSTYYPELDPVVIVLSDGMDLQASDKAGLSILTADAKVEAGSTYWAPWGDMASGEQYYKDHVGKYTLNWASPSTSTYWMYALSTGSVDRYRYGLLNSDIPIYTIGLGLEHHEPPYLPEIKTNPLSGYGDHKLDYTNAVCTGTRCLESGTLEYNLWRIATTSDAQYFYAPTADQLKLIFEEIGKLLAKPQEQTRGSEPTRQEEVPNENKWTVTPEFDISSAGTSVLSFWHKYNMVDGANGGYVMVGYRDPLVDTNLDGDPTNDWDWKYITPLNGFYTGSLYPGYERKDSFGNSITWAYNGRSAKGSFSWEVAQFDILKNVPEGLRDQVKIRFFYIQYGGGTGDGWWLDDVKVVVSRADEVPVTAGSLDTWRLVQGSISAGTTHSGTNAWFAGGVTLSDDFHDGIDNSLYTRPIDLTNAKYVYMEFYTRFNIQIQDGRPPDGFRVEISRDNGQSWSPLNFGVRAAWKVSGTEGDLSDNMEDDRSFTGIMENEGDRNWVPASSITHLTMNLNGYTGNVIVIRFRIVTNIDGIHCEEADFKGMYIDDVKVYGESLESTRSGSWSCEWDMASAADLSRPSTDGNQGSVEGSQEDEDILVSVTSYRNGTVDLMPLLLLISAASLLLILMGSRRGNTVRGPDR
ncbi:MAG: hypothetical protein JXA22_09085 [Candidatus Thermoplasmatota archaeon]|nr:hypothetical protein [Candidatus Thermoplasmatota archaeon]